MAKNIANHTTKDTPEYFYEERYSEGYMDDWSPDSKRLVRDIIRSMDLPEEGDALDFGCGTGVFTRVIRQELPKWSVYGADISRTAILAATGRHRSCIFAHMDDPGLAGRKFDFVFSHHVLEHVHDLSGELRRIDGFAAKGASILHILPCGNEGSFEHGICQLVKNGIDRAKGNRFFFEDPSHLRRLNTEEMKNILSAHGMVLAGEYYSNQYYGSILWITEDPRNVWKVCYVQKAVDAMASFRLHVYRIGFLLLCLLRLPSVVVTRYLGKKWNRRPHHHVLFAAALPFYPVSCWFDLLIRYKSRREWCERKDQKNGSQMFLRFKKVPAS